MADYAGGLTHTVLQYVGFVLPLLALLGFFERRQKGSCKFRIKLLYSTAIALFSVALSGGMFLTSFTLSVAPDAAKVAEQVTRHNMVAQGYIEKSLQLLFHETLTDDKLLCLQRGLSNFIEDKWEADFHAQKDCLDCGDKALRFDDYANHLSITYNKQHNIYSDFGTIGKSLNITWLNAAKQYNFIRRLYREPIDKNGTLLPVLPEDEANLFKNYLAHCHSYTPLHWTNAKSFQMESPFVAVSGIPFWKSKENDSRYTWYHITSVGALIIPLGLFVFLVVLTTKLLTRAQSSLLIEKRKWVSIGLTVLLSTLIALALIKVPSVPGSVIQGEVHMERPNLTAIAIKLGVYSLYRNKEIEAMLPTEQRKQMECSLPIIDKFARTYQLSCTDDAAKCEESFTPLAKEELLPQVRTQCITAGTAN